MLSRVLINDLRLEAKFYCNELFSDKEFLLAEEILESANYNSIYGLNTEGIGYPTLRMNEFDNLFTGSPAQYSNKFTKEDFIKHRLNKDDILICRTNGNPNLIGKSALVAKDYPYVYESHLFKVRADRHIINSATLILYLNTKHGRSEINRLSMQGNQANFSLAKFKEVRVPKLSLTFSEAAERIVYICFNLLESSKQTYAEAENILLAEVGLESFTPSTDPVNVKHFSESFASSGRLDAEYYQRKYDDYLALIHRYRHGHEPISKACVHKGQNYTPDAKTEYRYIELSNIGKSGDINGCTVNIGAELPSRARRQVASKDVIVSSIEGSLDSCAMVTPEYDGALCSTGFYVLQPKRLNAETMLVLFKSELMQNLLKQNCSGTILTAINKEEFLNIPLPLIEPSQQQRIAALVEESFALKQQSEALLEVAKRAVEIAIEEDEAAALRFIASNV